MKKRKLLWLLIGSLLLGACFSGTAAAGHPALAIMEPYADDLEDMETIEPYIISILALNETVNARRLDAVKQFIGWYFSRLNYPDRYGLTGTVYVYTLEGGREHSTRKYDSADGYAGLFLHLLHQYVVKTGDVELVLTNWQKIEDIAYILPVLQDKDGLTKALPGRKEKYLMDNCEVYGGLTAYLELRNIAGKGPSAYYSRVRGSVKRAIFTRLYDSESKLFHWAAVGNTPSRSTWGTFYPDAYAQIFPIYYEVLNDTPLVRDRLWRMFSLRYAEVMPAFPVEQRLMYELTKAKMEGKGFGDARQ